MSKEYIEREVLLEKLHNVGGCDADTGTWTAGYDAAIDLAIDILKKAPAADVVEVVRCRDCKHKIKFQNRIMCDRRARYSTVHSEWYGLTATDNENFCSYGERKEHNNA